MVQSGAGESRQPASRRQLVGGRESGYAYLTLLPVLLIMAAFSLYPIGYSLYLSLHKEVLTDPLSHPFVGFQNFSNALHSYYLTSSRRWMLNGDYGILNSALFQLGIIHDYIPWLSQPALARMGLALAHVWREGPLAAIFLLAGLQTIPSDLYSAAAVDGAGRVAAFRRITLPLLRPTIVIVLIYETIVAATTFDLVYVMTGGGPADATSLISWYAYAEVFKFLDLGTGAALGGNAGDASVHPGTDTLDARLQLPGRERAAYTPKPRAPSGAHGRKLRVHLHGGGSARPQCKGNASQPDLAGGA